MDYRIGIVAELFGLTGETLRNYERAGLISSKRGEGNDYRHYDINTITKLLGIRTLRNEGFTIDELQQVYSDISFDQFRRLVKEKIEVRQRELIVSEAIQKQLLWVDECFSLIANDDRYSLEQSPALYVLPYRKQQLLKTNGLKTGRLAQWAKNLFLVQSYTRYSDTLQAISGDSYKGAMAVTPHLANLLDIDVSHPVRYQEPVMCVRCLCERNDTSDPFSHEKAKLSQYMNRHGLKLMPGAFSLTVSAFHSNNEKHSYMCLYVPVCQT